MKNKFGLSLLTALIYWLPSHVLAVDVEGVRVWPAPDHTRIVLDLNDSLSHKLFSLSNPDRLVLDLTDATTRLDISKLIQSSELVRGARSGIRNGDDLRIVFDLASSVSARSFVLAPSGQYGDRLVLDLYPEGKTESAPVATKPEDHRPVIVAIDAGHGGDDPGAIGSKGIREKNIVLSIARELNALFAKEPGFKPVLIRDSDYFVALRGRTDKARQQQADIFVSIHADAFQSPQASGASVYVLSQRGASSETARWLAESENKSDLIGGVNGVSLNDKDEMLKGVLLDLSMTASLRASTATANAVLKELGSVTKLHKKHVEQAGFVVLKSPDVPSILVETGFVSNPDEASRLSTSAHQKKIAKALYAGVKSYFVENPPADSWLAWQQQQNGPRQYRVAKGDTLSDIAMRNKTSTTSLIRVNGLQNDQIRVGQVLQIPAS